MKILVTGATGFLGSHIVKALLKEKHQVIIFKRSFSNICQIQKELDKIVAYDIDKCDLDLPFKEQGQIDAIIHTATCYGRKNETITAMQEANTVFPLQLLEMAIMNKTEIFINTDTVLDKYLNYYALSKKQFVEWGRKLADEGNLRFINVALEHFYGPNDSSSKFVTYVIEQCKNNVGELDLTMGEQKRDFLYIEDVVNIYKTLLKQKCKSKEFQEYEAGSGMPITIKELVEKIHKLTKSKTKLNFGAIPYRENELMESHTNIEKLKALGWEPKENIETGIRKCIGDAKNEVAY